MPSSPSPARTEIVFVFNNLPDWQQLAAGVQPGAQVVVLDGAQDGLAQIAAHLQGRAGVDAIHILSHGQPGSLLLGSLTLDQAALAARADTLTQIGGALSDSGDILLYGCDVAQDSGAAFVQQIASLTQADVAASADRTGAAERGGNWVLEFCVGEVFSSHSFNPNGLKLYNHLLVLPPGTQPLSDIYWSNNTGINTVDGFALTESTGATRASSSNSIYYNTAVVKDDPGVAGNYYYELTWTADSIDLGKFDLDGMVIQSFGGNYRLDFSATSGGSYVSQTFTYNGAQGPLTVDLNTATFNDINAFTVRVTNLSGATSVANMDLQQLLLSDLSPPNTESTIGNLHGDTVAWAGVGNTVGLDAGGNTVLADAELGALNSGNGDWSGATLAVQRAGTAVSSDDLGFDTAGALFTVSGSTLQSGGQTFATYTNSGGALAISFTSSATTATTALVNDVAQRITYRNDTPTGDATLRYTLSDGTDSATADVAVTSDTIYVTNATDTATIDVSNGVSLSEAIAIAALDSTGSQTIVIAPSLAGQTLTLAGNVAINESLTLDLSAANDVALADSTLTLGGGATLTVVNGAGNAATIYTALAGSGALVTVGLGDLWLMGSNGSHSGSVSVNAGTLHAIGGSALGDTSAVSVQAGATLVVGGNETTGSLAGAGLVLVPLAAVLTTGGANTSTTFSGSIWGAGGLSKVGTGTLTLGGSNSYDGSTQIAAGTLAIASDSNLGAGQVHFTGGALAVTGATTIDNAIVLQSSSSVRADSNVTLSGAISGAGGLVKTGFGTLTLSGGNTHSGGTQVDAGTLGVANGLGLGTGAVTLGGGTLEFAVATTIANAIQVTSNSGIRALADTTLSGALTGAANLDVFVPSVLSLANAANDLNVVYLQGGSRLLVNGGLTASYINASSGTTLLVNGALTASNIHASSGSTLGGSGTIGGDVYIWDATLSPGSGADTGVLTINGNLSLNDGSTLTAQINGPTPGTGYDQVVVNGTVFIHANTTLAVTHGYPPASGDAYTLILNDVADAVAGAFNGLAEGGTRTAGGNGTVLTASYVGGTGNDVTLTAPTNAAPVAVADSLTVAEGGTATTLVGGATSVLANDTDAEASTLVSVLVTGPAHGSLTLNANGTFSYVHNGSDTTTDSFSYKPNDGTADGNTVSVAITVTPVNDAPANTVPGAQVITEDNALVFSVGNGNALAISDVDAGGSPLEVNLSVTNGTLTLAGTTGLSFTTGDGTADSTLVFSGTLVDINNALAGLAYTPTANYHGAAVLSLVTSDLGHTGSGGALTDTDSVNITVTPSNDAPTVANAIPNQNATEDAAFTFQVAANAFADVDVGDTLTYTAQLSGGGALPSWLSFDPVTRTFSGTPLNAHVGTLSIDVIASDGNGVTVTDTFDVVVANTNDAPTVANAIPNQNATEDAAFTFQFAADAFADVDVGDTLTYTAQLSGGGALPSWLSFDSATRTFSGTPLNAHVGTLSIDVIASDGNGVTVTDTFDVVVANTNDAPTVANAIPDHNATIGAPFSFAFSANTFADMDLGDTLTYIARVAGGGALPSWLSFDAATRTFSGTPANGDKGTLSIEVIADDGNGGTVTDSFDVVVAAAPVVPAPEEPTPPTPPVVPGIPDNDGVPNVIEDQAPGIPGPDGTTMDGDGNGDGIKDSQQPSVGSISFLLSPTAESNPGNAPPTFTTLVASSQNGKVGSGNDNSRILSLSQKDAPADVPQGMEMPIGLISFTVELGQGKSGENFSLYLDPALGVNGYWKQDASGTWVNIASEPYGGKTVMEGGKLRLDFHIEDGGQFDADGKVDGIITDPGAPAHMPLSITGMAPDLPQGFWF